MGWHAIREIINLWQSKGLVVILKDPENASDDDVCLEALKLLDGTEFLPDWIRDR